MKGSGVFFVVCMLSVAAACRNEAGHDGFLIGRAGEIDLIAKDGEYLVFCEVKYRSDGRKGSPLEAVGAGKQRTIFRCAMFYLTEHHMGNVPCRFDVVGIEGTEVVHIKNAFAG